MRSARVLVALIAVVSLILSAIAGAARAVEPGTYPVAQLPALARQFAPGISIPTRIPAGIVQFRLAPGRLPGYAPRAAHEVQFEKNGSSLLGFKLDVLTGSLVTSITTRVKAYLTSGGWTVTTSPFTAGRYRGVFESQTNGGIRFEMYTWASGTSTYVLTTYVLYGGKPQNPWAKKAVIASFRKP